MTPADRDSRIIPELDEKPTEREDKLVRKIRDSKLPPARRELTRYRARTARSILEFAARLVCPWCDSQTIGLAKRSDRGDWIHATKYSERFCKAERIHAALAAHDAAMAEIERLRDENHGS